MKYPLLALINSPADLKKLPKAELPQVATELRACFMANIARSGGHFASNLGAVELTVALHYVFDTPHDHLLWDVGHQTYPHKIITGRKKQIHTIRQFKGLAPFPKLTESVYDTSGVGHSSTSISLALGLALADRRQGKNHFAVAVIGDGAMTAGMAFEALNHAGDHPELPLIVILNDNEMSISDNVGAFQKNLTRNLIRDVKDFLTTFKLKTSPVLNKIPLAGYAAGKIEAKMSDLLHTTRAGLSLFDNLGFHYTGVIDGHNVLQLVEILEFLKTAKGPQLLHIKTQKGYGFEPARLDPIGFHAVGTFAADNPPQTAAADNRLTYSRVFGTWITELAATDKRVTAITPAMREGSGLVDFERLFPERYFDVGIAEQHAVTLAAGLALGGEKPIVAIYSTFLQRAYDQLIHDVAVQNLPVLFAVDRAGVVGEDGPTHIGAYDLSFLRAVPNMTVAAPSDENECRLLLSTCYALNTPAAVRYPRGTGPGTVVTAGFATVPVGKGIIRRHGQKIAFLAFGSMVAPVLTAAAELNATVADMRFVKPIDTELITALAARHDFLVTVEENTVLGGAGSAVSEVLAAAKILIPTLILGIADIITPHGNPQTVLNLLGLDATGIIKRVREFMTA